MGHNESLAPNRPSRRSSGGRKRPSWRAAALAISALITSLNAPAMAAEPTATVVEYYNATLNHYFITADPAEAAMLDFGFMVPGWQRSGVEFSAWADAGDASGIVPVCRFFGTSDIGPNSHFYTASAAECALVKKNPKWTSEGVAFYIAEPVNDRCANGTTAVYRSFYPGAAVSESNHRFLTDLTMHQRMAGTSILEGNVMCAPLSATEIEADAVRLLEQATFGPTDASIEHVKAVGAEAFVGEQLTMPRADTTEFPWMPNSRPATCVDNATAPIGPDSFCNRDNYSLYQVQRQFFLNSLLGPDQLRQRVAWALSQILVVSQTGGEITMAYAMQRYQHMLADLAFDNYENILTQVTLSPVMGNYLDMVNNRKPTATIQSNENYAREILQLFSIGLWKLNLDGTLMQDDGGNPIPTYGQAEITNFARVFTGWIYPTSATERANTPYYEGQMAERPTDHDTTSKTLLDGAVAPANLTMSADLANAISNIFNHPNLGPFISKQLIQKLVTSDPTPQYVARIASVFNDNGAGVRGDLKEVVRAILLDPEARGATKLDSRYGKLREPVLYVMGMARALNAATDGLYFTTQNRNGGQLFNLMQQVVYNAPTVFNYYPPDYTVPFTDAIGPEFGIQTTTTAFARVNFANTISFTGTISAEGKAPLEAPQVNVLYGATGTQLDWSALVSAASDPLALVARLDRLLMHNTMSSEAKNAIITAVNAVTPATDLNARARTAFYLVVASPQYQVER